VPVIVEIGIPDGQLAIDKIGVLIGTSHEFIQVAKYHGRYICINFIAVGGVKGVQHAVIGADVNPGVSTELVRRPDGIAVISTVAVRGRNIDRVRVDDITHNGYACPQGYRSRKLITALPADKIEYI